MTVMNQETDARLSQDGRRIAELRAALRQVIAALKQPVQFSGLEERSTVQILRGDCASAVRMAEAALNHDAKTGARK